MTLLLHLSDVDEAFWARRFAALLPDVVIARKDADYDPKAVRIMFVWKPASDAFEGLENLELILSLGAGVDALLAHPGLPANVPIVRFVDAELSQCMSDYVVAQVSMHHRMFSRYQADQKTKIWRQYYPPAAGERSVGIMGLGVLGQAAIARLKPLGFDLAGWSRSHTAIDGVTTFAGDGAFAAFLARTDILVNLLPLTPATAGILCADLFAKLRRSERFAPVIVNAARGGHQVEADIAAALTDGTLGAASLDVFETEPLPADSPLWALRNCYITPHIAAISNPETGVNYFASVARDHLAGRPLPNLVNRDRGY